MNSFESTDMVEVNRAVVPKIPAGVSGTALAASLLRDGWSVSSYFTILRVIYCRLFSLLFVVFFFIFLLNSSSP